MRAVTAVCLLAALRGTLAIKYSNTHDDLSVDSNTHDDFSIGKALAAGGGVGAVSGAVSGWFMPQGAQGAKPVLHGATNGAIAGGGVSMLLPSVVSLSVGSPMGALGAATTGAIGGAGAGAGVAALKEWSLNKAAQNCTQIPVQSNFNLTSYIQAPWYIQWQAEQFYQRNGDMNCTKATYSMKTGGGLNMLWKWDVDVKNEALDSNGGNKSANLCGEQQAGAKLAVAPCFLPPTAGGPYWVVLHDETAGHAIVLGGQPDSYNSTTGKCNYKKPLNNGKWIFTRNRILTTAEEATVLNLKNQYLENTLNVDTSDMIRTPQHANCPP